MTQLELGDDFSSDLLNSLIAEQQKPLVLVTPTTLPELFAAHGVTLAQVALALGVESALFDRVITGRQALAVDLVPPLAALLGVGRGEVAACAGYLSTQTGARAHAALPPEIVRGEDFPTWPLSETKAPRPTDTLPSLAIWVCGAGLGPATVGHGVPSGVVRIERNSGLLVSRTGFDITGTPVEMATDGTTVFCGGSVAAGAGYSVARLVPATGALIDEVPDVNLQRMAGAVFEPVSGTVWVCLPGAPKLVEIDRSNGAPVSIVQMTIEGLGYSARDIIAANGLLYVTATHDNNSGPNYGAVFELDPVDKGVLRSSTGLNLQDAWGLAYDGDNTIWVTSRASAGNTAMVSAVEIKTMEARPLSVVVDAHLPITDPSWVEYFFGDFWITDLTGDGGRLLRVQVKNDDTGQLLQERGFGAGEGGHCTSDGWFLWYADKANGLVHLLNPAAIATSQITVVTRGAPDGILIL